jgi:radical SAM superfamily enzyme YgiQ (UPF0313 family)
MSSCYNNSEGGNNQRMLAIEQGPIRPPSEARSLLLRVTRNCSWNYCEFCHIYKGQRFSPRRVEEVKKDIDTIHEIASEIAADPGHIALKRSRQYPENYRSVLMWLHSGARNVFLQDANNLILRTKDLVEILAYLKKVFPSVNRITTYSRARTISRKPLSDLKDLHDAGLSRIHVGLESGYDPILEYVQKGVTAQEHIDAGRKVKEAGISLSEYVMPGLGGKSMSRMHAVETARVLNQIDPDFIRIRTFKVLPIMPIYRKVASGELQLLNDDEIVTEERLFIENLDGISSHFASDHILNLLEELEGDFPEAKVTMLATIDLYLSLPRPERENFRLGRRAGFYHSLDDLNNPSLRPQVDMVMRRIEQESPGNFDQIISELMESFI